MKKEEIHYHRNTLEVLHEEYMCETLTECSKRSFSQYVPDNILKPIPEDWGTNLCKMCLNPELKVEGFKNSNVTLEWLLSLTNEELQDFEKHLSQNHLIMYKEW